MKRTKKQKPTRRVTSAEEQQERAALSRYRASLRRIQEIERLAKKMRRAQSAMREELVLLASRIAAEDGRYELVQIPDPKVVEQ